MRFLATRAALRRNRLKPAQETCLCWAFTIKWLIGQKFLLRRYLNGRAKLWRQLGLVQIRLFSKEEKVRQIIKSRRYRVAREETLHFSSSPEFGLLSPHIFTGMAEQQPSWQVLCHPPRLFPRRRVEYRFQNGPSGKYSRLPGSRANTEQLFLPKADTHFSFFFNCTFYM